MAKRQGNIPSQETLHNFGQEAISVLGSINDISKLISENASKLQKVTGDSAKTFKEEFNAAKKLADALASTSRETITSRREQSLVEKKILAAQKESIRIQNKGIEFSKRANKAKGVEREILERIGDLYLDATDSLQAQAQSSYELLQNFQRLNKSTAFLDFLADFADVIPGLNRVFPEFRKAAEASREAGGGLKGFFVGAREFSTAFGKAGLSFSVTKIVQGLNQGDQRVTNISRELNVSRDIANDLNRSFKDIAQQRTGILLQDLAEIQSEFSKQLGITADLSKDTLVTYSTLKKQLQLSTDQAAKLTEYSVATNNTLKDVTDTLVGNTVIQNQSNKLTIRYQDILQDVADSSAATQLSLSKNPRALADAAYQARRAGLNLQRLEGISGNLLDFQSSITAELEAELVLGRDLTLDRARLAAETNDLETLSVELAKNFGSVAEFSKLTRTQQELAARAVGQSREELASALQRQKAIQSLSLQEGQTLEQKYQLELKRINTLTNQEEKTRQLGELSKKIGNAELERQLKNQSVAEAQQEAIQSLADSASVFADVLRPIAGIFQFIGKNAGVVLGTLTAISTILLIIKRRASGDLLGGLSGSKSILGGLSGSGSLLKSGGAGIIGKQAMKGVADKMLLKTGGKSLLKLGGKALGKSLLKKIPVLGAVAGIGFAIDRLIDGDYVGALGELGSGVASTIPGLGTAVSTAIDAGLIARDVTKQSSDNQEIKAADFTIRTHPKDSIVMAGGTKFNDETNQLLRELIDLVKQGGHVYIDGNKVGQALVLSSYKSA